MLAPINKVSGKKGAQTAFGAKNAVTGVHNNDDHVGSFDLDIHQQPDQRMIQVDGMQNQTQNAQALLTPDQPARDMTSNLYNGVKRLSQTPQDYSKNLKLKKQRPLLPQIRQIEQEYINVPDYLNQVQNKPTDGSMNIESGSVQFIKEDQRSSSKDQIVFALKHVDSN